MNMNSYKEHAKDFTESKYKKIISKLKKTHKFIFYKEINKADKFVLWRHDCDYSINKAYKLAKIEKKLDVKGTYFLNPHCRFYNIFEIEQTDLIKKIIQLGHDIGLHFDSEYHKIKNVRQLEKKINLEKEILENFFEKKISVFSFHNPDSFTLSLQKEKYGGLINCYSKKLKEDTVYCSDSNGYWRHSRLHNFIQENSGNNLQILTHPGWWQTKEMQPRDRIIRAIEGRKQTNIKLYDMELKKFGRKNISSEN